MIEPRIIACMMIDREGLKITKKFKQREYVGDPLNTIKIFSEKEVDEIIVIDIDASKKSTPPDFSLLEMLSSQCFAPLCYGGGVNSVEYAKEIIKLGVEKILVNSSAMKDPSIIGSLSKALGSSAVVACIDFRESLFGDYKLYSHVERRNLRKSVASHIEECLKMGAGEIVLHNVSRDGLMKGYDLKFLKEIKNKYDVPLIAMGGAGSRDDLINVKNIGISPAAGALFTYSSSNRSVLINYPKDLSQVESI